VDVTASFLEGAILSWAIPLALLILVTIWWVGIVRSRDHSDQDS
jgi:cytochrome c-type biogenesis protein CcmH/NrfF